MKLSKLGDTLIEAKDKLTVSAFSLGIRLAERVASLLGQSDKVLEGKLDGLISIVEGKSGEDLIVELHILYATIQEVNLFRSDNDRYQFVKILIQKTPGIQPDNYEQIKSIFPGFEEEFERADFFVNLRG